MTDSPQEDDSHLFEQALPIGNALNGALEHLKRVNDDIHAAMARIEHLAIYVVGAARYSDEQYRRATDEIVRIDTVVLPELEAQRIAALSMLIDAQYPVSVHYR